MTDLPEPKLDEHDLSLDAEAVQEFPDPLIPIDDHTVPSLSWWAKRRRRRAVYRAARTQGDSLARATHLAIAAATRNLSVATALDGRTAWQ